jgi:predicted nucleic acid-binding protein
MIADTTFLVHLLREHRSGTVGPARTFFVRHRREIIRTTIISLAEAAVSFPSSDRAWNYFRSWSVYRLHDGIAKLAADLDRELGLSGQRLGENDNWIAGFCRYYREPVISLDAAFDRVPRLRRITY